jgi:hypothetical protein
MYNVIADFGFVAVGGCVDGRAINANGVSVLVTSGELTAGGGIATSTGDGTIAAPAAEDRVVAGGDHQARSATGGGHAGGRAITASGAVARVQGDGGDSSGGCHSTAGDGTIASPAAEDRVVTGGAIHSISLLRAVDSPESTLNRRQLLSMLMAGNALIQAKLEKFVSDMSAIGELLSCGELQHPMGSSASGELLSRSELQPQMHRAAAVSPERGEGCSASDVLLSSSELQHQMHRAAAVSPERGEGCSASDVLLSCGELRPQLHCSASGGLLRCSQLQPQLSLQPSSKPGSQPCLQPSAQLSSQPCSLPSAQLCSQLSSRLCSLPSAALLAA